MPATYGPEFSAYAHYPRVTSILDIRKNESLERWKRQTPLQELIEIQVLAQRKGNDVHDFAEKYFSGQHELDTTATNLALKIGLINWAEKFKPTPIAVEQFLHNDELEYKGSADLICEIAGELWIVDFKTSKRIQPSYALQLAAYKAAYGLPGVRLGILHLHEGNKRCWSFKEAKDEFNVFKAHLDIYRWMERTGQIIQPAPAYSGGIIKST